MVFQLIILGLVLGLTAFFAFEGLYSALLMALCAIVAAVLAFNYAEPAVLGLMTTASDFSDGLAFGVLFLVPLVVTRLLADKFLPGMVHLPYLVDRIGGAGVGFVAATIIGGAVAVTWTLLPFGPSFLGYEHFAGEAAPPGQHPKVQPLWLRSDAFTLGLARMLSGGALSGSQPLALAHPDYQEELAGFANVFPSTHCHATTSALAAGHPPSAWWVTDPAQFPPGFAEQQAKATGLRLFRVNVKLASNGDEKEGEPKTLWLTGGQAQLTARRMDADGKVLAGGPTCLALADWIIVEPPPAPPPAAGAAKAPAAAPPPRPPSPVEPPKKATLEPLGVDRVWQFPTDDKTPAPVIGLLFLVPENYKPWFLTVKRHTQVDLETLGKGAGHATAPAPGSVAAAGPTERLAVSGAWGVANWRKSVAAQLPLSLSAKWPNDAGNGRATLNLPDQSVELAGGKLAKAQVQGLLGGLAAMSTGNKAVTEFAVPPGFRIIQLEGDVTPPIARPAWWGRIKAAMVRADGNVIPLAGVVLKTDGNAVLCYDSDHAPGRFDKANLDSLGGRIQKVCFILVAPAGAKDVDLDLGDGLMIKLTDLPK